MFKIYSKGYIVEWEPYTPTKILNDLRFNRSKENNLSDLSDYLTDLNIFKDRLNDVCFHLIQPGFRLFSYGQYLFILKEDDITFINKVISSEINFIHMSLERNRKIKEAESKNNG